MRCPKHQKIALECLRLACATASTEFKPVEAAEKFLAFVLGEQGVGADSGTSPGNDGGIPQDGHCNMGKLLAEHDANGLHARQEFIDSLVAPTKIAAEYRLGTPRQIFSDASSAEAIRSARQECARRDQSETE